MKNDNQLKTIVQKWNMRTASAEVTALAEAARLRHDGVVAVLFYGSCLRGSRVDEGLADLYLLVDDYHRAFASRLQALMNRLLPPNVFYLEVPYEGKTVRAKYAVLTLEDFGKGAQRWFHSYIWGRFAQPSGLIYARDGEVTARIQEALAGAVRTFVARTLPQAPELFTIRELWSTGLSLSYRCELRSEDHAKTVRLFDAATDYYEAVTPEALKDTGLPVETLPGDSPTRYRLRISPWERKLNSLAWRLRQIQGKGLSVLRLLKALLTFENGVDYILWKIERHSGVRVESSPALKRFPLLAVCVTFWRLFRKGAFR
jgi:predicted nucleotidyltransferase